LHCPLIVVVGHESCGAVKAVVDGGEAHGSLGALLERIHAGKGLPEDKKAALPEAVKNNVLHQARELTFKSTVLRDFATSGRVRIVAGVYSLKTGAVEWLELPQGKGDDQEGKR
jgi:carbonic anhydrase